jgi:hypothetical protein
VWHPGVSVSTDSVRKLQLGFVLRHEYYGFVRHPTYMRQYDDLVLGEVDVRFNGVCADFYGGAECAERVFWICSFVASMGDRYW